MGRRPADAATSEAASSTCSQLSSTSKSRRSRRYRMTVSRSDCPGSRGSYCGGNRRHDEVRIGERGEIDEAHTIRVVVPPPGGDRQCQAGLPVPPGPVSVTSWTSSRARRSASAVTRLPGRSGGWGDAGAPPSGAESIRSGGPGAHVRARHGEEAGPIVLTEREGLSEQAHRLQARCAMHAPLQVAQRAHAQPGALGQRLLGEGCRRAVPSQELAEAEQITWCPCQPVTNGETSESTPLHEPGRYPS